MNLGNYNKAETEIHLMQSSLVILQSNIAFSVFSNFTR